jgi:GNAT superfamily N-acetyltransferase
LNVIRRIEASDVPQLFRVRAATDENRLTLDQLAALGINENSVREKLLSRHQGWLCEEQGSVVGFAMGDRSSGEIWVIAMLPTYIRRGIGGALLEKVETWLFSEGYSSLWLTTDVDTRLRAYANRLLLLKEEQYGQMEVFGTFLGKRITFDDFAGRMLNHSRAARRSATASSESDRLHQTLQETATNGRDR